MMVRMMMKLMTATFGFSTSDGVSNVNARCSELSPLSFIRVQCVYCCLVSS